MLWQIFIVVTILHIPIDARSDFVKPYPSNAGIYFDSLGKLKIIKSNLNVISYVDISFIKPHLTNLNEIIGTLRFNCQKFNLTSCENTLSPLTARFTDVQREYDSIYHLISKRYKRNAWFGGIGTVFKHVFGTLDEDDALKYDSAIESIQNNQKKMATLIKENILVTTSTLESYKNIINKLKTNQEIINESLISFLKQITNITEITNNLIIETKVHSILTNLESSLLTLSFQLEDLINAIILSSQNILHPNIVTPAQLYRELADNDRHLPRDTGIPISLSLDNIHLILSISNVACYYFKNKLVFVLQVPLVTNEEFNLYHTLALPTPHRVDNPNSYSLISPTSSYIAISNSKQLYCNLDSLRKCKTIYSEFFLCEVPVISTTSDNPICESELLTKTVNAIPKRCVTKTIFGELDIWQPLINNRWIFVQSRPNKVSIECGVSEMREIIVSGTGILDTPKQCTIYTKSVRLITSDDSYNISIPSPILDFNIINDSCCQINYNSINNNTSPILFQNIDLDDLTSNVNKHKEIFAELDKIIDDKPFIIKYGTHYSILTFIILLIVISFIIYILIKIILKYKNAFVINRNNVNIDNDTHVENDNASLHSIASIPLPRLREVV
ncbi:uncharacterized protein LOC124629572 [Helicoverpa zea]|uniref:uncharacterized protein LOC124629572 n=1 Tax=Helicoverpa zea TaxID=7113 RepID=UPI001F5695F4|nr:uncharacterized protein LOC124629572 [Helicoverpa zea]